MQIFITDGQWDEFRFGDVIAVRGLQAAWLQVDTMGEGPSSGRGV